MSAPSSYGYGQYGPPPARRSGMEKAGKWMFIIGLILTLITAAVVAWGATATVRAAEATTRDTIAINGTTTVPMEAATLRMILADAGQSPTCTAQDPAGNDISVSPEQGLEDVDGGGSDAQVIGSILAETAGDYTVECTGGSAYLSGPLGAGALGGVVAAVLGVLALIPLGLLTLVGLILWLVGRNKNKKLTRGPGGYDGGYGATPGSSYGQSGYGQQSYGTGQSQTYGQSSSTDPYAPPPPPGSGSSAYGTPQDSPYGTPGQSQGYQGQNYGSQTQGQQQPPFPPYGSRDSGWAAPGSTDSGPSEDTGGSGSR